MNTLFNNYNYNINGYNKYYSIHVFIDRCIKSSGHLLGMPILHKLYFHTSLNSRCFIRIFSKCFNRERPFYFDQAFVQLNKNLNKEFFDKNKKILDFYFHQNRITE